MSVTIYKSTTISDSPVFCFLFYFAILNHLEWFSLNAAAKFYRPRAEHFVLKLVWRLKGALGHFWRRSLLFWRIAGCSRRSLTQLFWERKKIKVKYTCRNTGKEAVEGKELVLKQNGCFFACSLGIKHSVMCCYGKIINGRDVWWSRVTVSNMKLIWVS